MQREQKWHNWPILVLGLLIVAGLVCTADFVLSRHKAVQTYLLDMGGAITAIVLSIATYDEWERRKQRQRYLPPEKMGVARIQEEISQLLYQYAFVLSLRFDPASRAMRTVRKVSRRQQYIKPEAELRAKAAKHLSQSEKLIKSDLFNLAAEALKKIDLGKQTNSEVNQLILQTERSIRQIDLAISTYGYSFTPEIHKWALDVREAISHAITGKLAILDIRLAAASRRSDKPLDKLARDSFGETVEELIDAGRQAKNAKVEE
jgi:UDP-N-acetylglucosamine transferase subunit ALG13